MDTKFSVALHILTMISESKETLSSQALAESVWHQCELHSKGNRLIEKRWLNYFPARKNGLPT